MGEAAERLLAYRHAKDCYTVPFAEIRDLQIAAMNERLQERIDKIKLVKFRADKGDITAIRSFDDIVPMLLPHTAYKSYPESYLLEGKWDKLTKWLGTVSTYPVDDTDLTGIRNIDEWIARLDEAGHPVSCSSGTTGKSAMLIASRADNKWSADDTVVACAHGTGVTPAQDRHVYNIAPVASVPRNTTIMNRMKEAFGKPETDLFVYPVPPITVGALTRMVALRKAMVDGSAMPADIEEYERTSAERTRAMEDAVGITVDALLKNRGEKLYLFGVWGNIYRVAAAIRERGYSTKDFHPENMLYTGGGLKREQVPDNYREFVRETFNITPRRNFQFYGMQEIGSTAPCCVKGRHHFPPWLVFLPLNKDADALVPVEGQVQCRAGLFDLSVDGRWGGVISGDRVEISFDPCECGAGTPSISDNIVRYADLEGDDKIACSGTIDAYVRGVA